MKKKLIITFLVCGILGLIAIILFKNNDTFISSSTYDSRRFFTACDTGCKNIDEYDNKYTPLKTVIRSPYVIKFKDKDIIFECAVAGRGWSKEKKTYYVILYKNGILKYIKGDMLAQENPVTDKVYNKMLKYYEGKNIDYEPIVILSDYKEGQLKLLQEEADVLIEKLMTAEQYYPYDDKFHRDTGKAFVGYYFNGNYYGMSNHVGDDEIVYETYNDVYDYIEYIIGI